MQCNSMNLLHTNANVSMGELVQIYEFFMALFSYFLKDILCHAEIHAYPRERPAILVFAYIQTSVFSPRAE